MQVRQRREVERRAHVRVLEGHGGAAGGEALAAPEAERASRLRTTSGKSARRCAAQRSASEQSASERARRRLSSLDELPEIHSFLDGFYLSRIGIRMLIGQHIALHEPQPASHYIGMVRRAFFSVLCVCVCLRERAKKNKPNGKLTRKKPRYLEKKNSKKTKNRSTQSALPSPSLGPRSTTRGRCALASTGARRTSWSTGE